jgi:hypothetical protein
MTKEQIKSSFVNGSISCYSAVARLEVLGFTNFAAWEYIYA